MKFPDTLKDIKLKSYQEFLSIDAPTNEDLIKCFLNINDEQLNRFKTSEVNNLFIHFQNLLQEDTPFVPTFDLNGITYGFIPDLDNITYGENKDITSYLNDFKTMHKAMAVAYRPIKHKRGNRYIIKQYKGSHVYSEAMREAPLSVVLGMVVFFYNLTNELLRLIPNYLKRELEKSTIIGQVSEQNGEIISSYIHSLREISEDLTRLQKNVYTLV